MKVRDAEFFVSAFSARDFPVEAIPEVVLAGRSNVGKSSLLNRLAGKKNLARISSTPGKTRSINFYRINPSLFFVDLPGYGYAKVSKSINRQWKELIESYFKNRPTVALVLHLVDARIGPTALDLELAEWLRHSSVASVIIATKTDKLSGNEHAVQLRALSTAFGGNPVIMSSAITGMGCSEIWKRVQEASRSNRARGNTP